MMKRFDKRTVLCSERCKTANPLTAHLCRCPCGGTWHGSEHLHKQMLIPMNYRGKKLKAATKRARAKVREIHGVRP